MINEILIKACTMDIVLECLKLSLVTQIQHTTWKDDKSVQT